ncbi:MAG: hypothetical protein WCI71_14990 [Bacteroidota bacterium]
MSGFTKKDFLFFFFLFFFIGLSSGAQEIKSPKPVPFGGHWQAGFCFGPDFYFGDLNKYNVGISRSVNVAGGVYVVRQFTEIFGVRGQMLIGGINGKKDTTYQDIPASKQFLGLFFEFNVNGTINFSNLFSPYKPSRTFFVLGTLGIGFTNWNSRREDIINGDVYNTIPDSRRWRTAAVIPFGIGAMYRITNKVNLNFEWTFRMVTSDLLDQTAGGFKFDFYDYFAIGVSVNLGKWLKKSQKILDYPYFSNPSSIVLPPILQQRLPEPGRQVFFPENEKFDYVVQICAYEKHNYTPTWIKKRYKISQPVIREREGKMSRYIIGSFKNIEPAMELRDKLMKKGVPDAFVVAYKNGVRHHTVTSGY